MAGNVLGTGKGARTYEFGPEPGATIMWFGKKHLGKRFNQIPAVDRRWLVERSKTKKTPNFLKFKRLDDEYKAWLAEQNDNRPANSPCSVRAVLDQNSTNRKRKCSQDDSSKTDSNIRLVEALPPRTTATMKQHEITPATDNTPASRTTADALRKTSTIKQAENQTPQRLARLKQTQLNFPRTPLGDMTPNKAVQSEAAPSRDAESKAKTKSSPRRKPALTRGTDSSKEGKVVDLLPISKGHTSPNSSFETKPKFTRPSITAEAPKSTPPPAKRRKTQSQKSETIIVEASSSQSSAPSPWRPVVHLAPAEDDRSSQI